MKKMIGILLMVFIAMMTAACSANSGPEPLDLTIELSEFAFSPQDLEFQVGQEVTLHLVNVGALGHEIMFGREVEMEDGQPHAYHTDMFEFAGVEPDVTMMEGEHSDDDEMHMEEGEEEHEHSGFMVEVPPGDDEYTMKFTVTEDMVGEWEIGCFDQNGVHYTAGMVGSLTVIP